MSVFNIAILDDEQEIGLSFKRLLELNKGKSEYRVDCYTNPDDLYDSFAPWKYDVLFIDLNIERKDADGIDVLKQLRADHPFQTSVLISGVAQIKDAVRALKSGADDFLEKPLVPRQIFNCLEKLQSKVQFLKSQRQLHDEILCRYGIIGQSDAIVELRRLIANYASLKEPVLVTGESGTGKELVAANLHYLSGRCDKKYYKLNIVTVSDTLIESQLFGHRKGSFSGAVRDHAGIFKAADNSSLFIDEIGEMKPGLQSKLLRTIQDGEILEIGSNEPVIVNVRLVFATNRDLQEMVKEGKFREDLYYRISPFIISMPPLRMRKNDIPLFVDTFLTEFCMDNNLPLKELRPNALDKLMAYDFPGNIRELKNIIVRSAALRKDESFLDADDIHMYHGSLSTGQNLFEKTEFLDKKRKVLEKQYIETQLDLHGRDLNRTADALGILKNNLYRKLKDLDIEY